jgi:uncharacterized membrane protein
MDGPSRLIVKDSPDPAARRSESEPILVEPRWPIAFAVGTYLAIMIVLRVFVPDRPTIGTRWLVPGLMTLLLAALVAADPARISARARWLRRLASALIASLAVVALIGTTILIADLIRGSEVTEKASTLLVSGALIWLGNVLVFSLLYWHFDSGGPLARYRGDRPYRDFAFTQHMSPELAPPGWRPQYVDYLILGLTTSTAFSPTDVMPIAVWAKLTMALQSLIALTVVGLVIARAVNVFS